MAVKKPVTEEEILSVFGVGEEKQKNYAAAFTKKIKESIG